MRKNMLGAVAAVMAMTPAAHAQTAGAFMANPAFKGPRPERCVSTQEMQRCAAHDLRVADAQMSDRYAALRDRLAPAPRQALLTEQRGWLRSRDRDCLARGGGGSLASLNVARCWVDVTKRRTAALAARGGRGGTGGTGGTRPATLPASAFVGRWRGGEGTYMKIARRGDTFVIDNQWGLDADMQGVFTGTLTPGGMRFRRNGVTETARPSRGDAINRSALRGKTDCLMVSREEGYCRY